MKRISYLLITSSILFPVHAMAQEVDAPDPNEIVVTAQKRAQALSDVSLSVTAVDSEKLASSGIGNIEGLQNMVPTISFGNDFNFAKLFIRGIGLSSSLPGVDPSVALHVDGAVVSLAQAQLGSMFDLERVEVLRGPQGTLYGRNSTGGAVNLITAKPTNELDGYVRLTTGGDAFQIGAEAAIGGPLAEGINARLALRSVHREGFGINELTGSDIDNLHQYSARAQVEFLPSEKLSILLSGEYHREDDRSLAIKFREVSFPGVLADANPLNDGLSALGQRAGASFSSNPRNLNTNFDPINDRKQWAVTGTVTLEASDVITLKSLTSYRDFKAIFFHDFDMSSYRGFPLAQTSSFQSSANHWQPVFQHQFSEEFQVNFDTDNLHGLVGLFYLDETIRVENHIGFDVLTNTDPFRVQFDGTLDVETWAAFANATYDLSEQLSVKAGARYSWEKRHLLNNRGIGTSAPSGFVLDALQWDTSRKWSNFSPSLGLEYRPNDDLLLYGNWSRGFKSGTAEIGSGVRTPTSASPFVNPEKVEAFEVGAKYAGGNFSINLATFFQRLKDGQFSLTRPINSPPFFTSELKNAAQSEAYGVELELQWRPTRAFTVNGSVAYLHSEFTSFLSKDPLNPALFLPPLCVPPAPGVPCVLVPVPDTNLSGNATRMSPRWSFNVNPSYEIELGDGGTVTLQSNVVYRSRQYHTEFNDLRLSSAAYTMVDANILYKDADDKFSLNLWVKNLTDKLVYAGSFSISTSRAIGGTLMPPRTYGVTAGVKF